MAGERDGYPQIGKTWGQTTRDGGLHSLRAAQSRDHKRADKPLFLYAVLLEDGFVKIGATSDIRNRFKAMPPKQFYFVIPGSFVEEHRLLQMFDQHRAPNTNEYFYPDPRMIQILENIGKAAA